MWAWGPEPIHQITKCECQTDPGKIKRDKLIKPNNRYHLPKTDKYISRGDFF